MFLSSTIAVEIDGYTPITSITEELKCTILDFSPQSPILQKNLCQFFFSQNFAVPQNIMKYSLGISKAFLTFFETENSYKKS